MLSPATPLTIALLVAFVLLLLTTLSTPVIKSIPLGNYDGVDFGVLGWCNGTQCSPPKVGYDPRRLWPAGEAPLHLSTGSRTKLSAILVVHPIAAFLVLVCTILAGTAHLPAAGHSPPYLLALLILTFPTLLVTLLAFLVDILLFVPPHMEWGGWIVLPAVLIITACSVVTCAMRRTLVSRMARKERIEKNDEMNGSAYYEMKAETQFRAPDPTPYRAPDTQYARAESPPPLDPVTGTEKTAQFSSYERSTPDTQDRSLANSGSRSRRPGDFSGSTMASPDSQAGPNGALVYDESGTPRRSSESRHRRPRGPPSPYGRGGGPPPQGYGRGRGGYPPPPRGGRGGYYPPRGAYGPPGPGGRGPPPGWRGGPRGRPGPPPGYPNGYPRGPPPPVMGSGGAVMYSSSRSSSRDVISPTNHGPEPWQGQEEAYQQQDPSDWQQGPYDDGRPSPGAAYMNDYGDPDSAPENSAPAYDTRPSTGGSITRDPASFGFSGRQPSPAGSQARSPSPPPPVPILSHNASTPGQAVEMNAHTGSPAGTPTGQQSDWPSQPVDYIDNESPPSRYATPADPLSGIQPPPDPQPPESHVSARSKPRASSDDYYEDMDPRFSEDTERPPIGIATAITAPDPDPIPPTLMPGYAQDSMLNQPQPHDPNSLYPAPLSRDPSQSPAPSDEGSNFTSISQRGINPQWQPAPGSYATPKWREQEQILNTNPDFVVPGAGPGRLRGGSASGNINASAAARGHTRGMASSGNNHRYPDPV